MQHVGDGEGLQRCHKRPDRAPPRHRLQEPPQQTTTQPPRVAPARSRMLARVCAGACACDTCHPFHCRPRPHVQGIWYLKAQNYDSVHSMALSLNVEPPPPSLAHPSEKSKNAFISIMNCSNLQAPSFNGGVPIPESCCVWVLDVRCHAAGFEATEGHPGTNCARHACARWGHPVRSKNKAWG